MYKIKHNSDNGVTELKSKEYKLTLTIVKDHIHVRVSGPNKFRKRGLSNVHFGLTVFEFKVVSLYFYRMARDSHRIPFRAERVNYADVFGSCFD